MPKTLMEEKNLKTSCGISARNPSLVEKLDASLPLSIAGGMGASLLASAFSFIAGLQFEKVILEGILKLHYPILSLASVFSALGLGMLVMTIKTGLQGDALKALLFGSAAVFVLGMLGALTGF